MDEGKYTHLNSSLSTALHVDRGCSLSVKKVFVGPKELSPTSEWSIGRLVEMLRTH